MLITRDILKEHHAPSNLVSFVERKARDGITFNDLAALLIKSDKLLAARHINWLRDEFGISADYVNDLLQCYESSCFYKCYNINQCENAVELINATNANSCFYSESVINSSHISHSAEIEASNFIFNSDFCTDCNRVINSKNCNNSFNIIDSNFIIDSTYIYKSDNITNSSHLRECHNCNDVYFSSWCENLTKSLFCTEISGEYQLFNKPITEKQYNVILKQFNKLVSPLSIITYWDEDPRIISIPEYTRNYSKFYLAQTDKFWQWVTTLPNYNARILYNITFLPKFMT